MRLTSNRGQSISTRGPRSPAWALTAAICGLLVTFELDRATGSAPLQHLYYLPIIVAGVRFGWRGGILMACAAIVAYHLANPFLLGFHYGESDLIQIALFGAVGATTAKLADDTRRMRELAMTDDLTGLHNLRSFEARLAAMIGEARASNAPLSLFVLDVDRLKSINDRHGHLAGAEAVRAVGRVLAERLPARAVACRYGGDEFVVCIPACSETQAGRIADDICRTVHQSAPVLAGVPFRAGTLSVSLGLVCRSFDWHAPRGTDADDGETLFRDADRALYLAKDSGRNRVNIAGSRRLPLS
jgi:diguanylate cyclase (GGDEF)-like protein